jgi:hypothetical protein
VLRELEIRAVEDAGRIVEEQRAKAERRRRWDLAMADARRQAYEHLDITALNDQLTRWREAQEILGYCQALAARLEGEPPDGLAGSASPGMAVVGTGTRRRARPTASSASSARAPRSTSSHTSRAGAPTALRRIRGGDATRASGRAIITGHSASSSGS